MDNDLFETGLAQRKATLGAEYVEKNLAAFLQLDLPGTKRVIGDGPQMAEYRSAFPAVDFVGYRFGEELAATIAAGDVFVFPSLTDTFGLVMLEAMACGTPVAAYPVTGPVDVIRQGETGWMNDDLGVAILSALELDRNACRAYANLQDWNVIAATFTESLVALDGKPLIRRVSERVA